MMQKRFFDIDRVGSRHVFIPDPCEVRSKINVEFMMLSSEREIGVENIRIRYL